jgi:hypothetical protein
MMRSPNVVPGSLPQNGSGHTNPFASITMRVLGVTGWTVFSTAPVRNSGRQSRFPMPETESRRGGQGSAPGRAGGFNGAIAKPCAQEKRCGRCRKLRASVRRKSSLGSD